MGGGAGGGGGHISFVELQCAIARSLGGLGALLPPGMFGEYVSEVGQSDKALSYTVQIVYLRGVDGQVSQMRSHDYC